MSNPFNHIQNHPAKAEAMIGINYEQFQQLLAQVERYEQQQREQREKEKIRINAKGGGRSPLLSMAEGLCLCLFYYRVKQLMTVPQDSYAWTT